MESTLNVGDRVLVNRLVYHFRPIQRGDVVVFDGTDSFVRQESAPQGSPITAPLRSIGQSLGIVSPDGSDFVKRVIGVPGDHVQCCDAQGHLVVNGKSISEPYVFNGDAPSELAFKVIVPEGKLWVMGDHRSQSADSRAHLGDPGGGMVSEDKVIGRVMAVLWPTAHWGSVSLPDDYGNVA